MNAGRTEKEKEQARVHIRWMIRRDMPEVLQTEQLSFEYAWNEEDFLRCLRQRNCIGMVAEQGEKVVGFMIYELHKSRLNILNFAVSPAYRRVAIGAQMVAKLISKLSSHRRTRITLEVRERHRLITQGVYRGVRHPMYSALALYSVGQALVITNWVAGPSNFVAFTVLLALRIGAEEGMMAQQFGNEYAAYTARTKRLIPRVW